MKYLLLLAFIPSLALATDMEDLEDELERIAEAQEELIQIERNRSLDEASRRYEEDRRYKEEKEREEERHILELSESSY